jgi:hypothetical protein
MIDTKSKEVKTGCTLVVSSKVMAIKGGCFVTDDDDNW